MNAASAMALYPECAWMRSSASSRNFAEGWGKHHHSVLFLAGTIFRRRDRGGPCLISLGSVERMAVLAWRLEEREVLGKRGFVISCEGSPWQWVLVRHAEDFEALQTEVWGPAHVRWATNSGAGAASSSTSTQVSEGILICESGPPQTMLRSAARQGFRGLGVTELDQTARDFGLNVTDDQSSTPCGRYSTQSRL